MKVNEKEPQVAEPAKTNAEIVGAGRLMPVWTESQTEYEAIERAFRAGLRDRDADWLAACLAAVNTEEPIDELAHRMGYTWDGTEWVRRAE